MKEHTPVNLSYPTVGAIICAAGSGSRTGFSENKLLHPLENSTALEKVLCTFDYHVFSQIVVTASEKDYDKIQSICKNYARVQVVLGGETRSKSVYNALKTVQTDIVLIHDGARPFVSRETINNCVDCVKGHGSGVVCVPATDTVAIEDGGKAVSYPARENVYHVQTPQGFFTQDILSAYEKAFAAKDTAFTDDSSLYLKYVHAPTLCAGTRENKKLTFAEDFARPTSRVGFGVDTHAFGKEQNYVVICGETIPHESGLIAHSDGDVAVHAAMDALLSAAGLNDIGHYFPDSDPAYKGANSLTLLQSVVDLLSQNGFAVKNLSIAIQAERPKMAKYISAMKKNLAPILKVSETSVGISVGTNEKLGYVGEGKGITAYAYALLYDL
ncbi:MAG: 2-C-methyl-D-erythritol 2,4-cyclodiphosphate synthase [Clostridia bacterium]|nr:2-C-methyl-D-erythritol 2,4-cyclodiphosphate synthase [Clostridia bacterium]